MVYFNFAFPEGREQTKENAMEFKEACSAVADLYEAIPETYISGSFYEDEHGFDMYFSENKSSAVAWCAIGGVSLATGIDREEVRRLLDPIAGGTFGNAASVSNRSRKSAIRLLRVASGEIQI